MAAWTEKRIAFCMLQRPTVACPKRGWDVEFDNILVVFDSSDAVKKKKERKKKDENQKFTML